MTTYSGDNVDIDAPSELSDHCNENLSSNGEGISAGEVLTRVELELAYSSEKFLNLDILFMHVAGKEGDFEALSFEDHNVSDEAVQKGLEFDLLSGVLDSEIRELEKFTSSLQREVIDARQMISSSECLEEAYMELEEKLHDSEKSLKQAQDQVADIKMQSDKLQRLSTFGGQEQSPSKKDADSDNDHFSYTNKKLKMQTAEQQRHILRMLEKSLARELDLEKKLSESRHVEEDLKRKLHSAQEELFFTYDATEAVLGRLLEAENAYVLLTEILKDLMRHLRTLQFTLNDSFQREGEMIVKHQNVMDQMKELERSNSELDNMLLGQVNSLKVKLKEVEDRCILSSSENFSLQNELHSLEEKRKVTDIKLQKANASHEERREHYHVSELDDVKKASSESEVNTSLRQINETNMKKVSLLEKQLRDSDIHLQHAQASVEAGQEQQSMLYSTVADMEDLIKDLKLNVSKAENRAATAESKCAVLSNANLELSNELNFLKSKTESLKKSFQKVNDVKLETKKEVDIRLKVIADLMLKLAKERERLQKQVSALKKENKVLVEKLWNPKKEFSSSCEKPSRVSTEVHKLSIPLYLVKEDATVRNIDAGQLNSKLFLLSISILLLAALTV